MVLKGLKKKLTFLIATPLLAASMVLAPSAPVAAYTDGLSFVYCNGRYNMGTVYLNGGYVKAYGCSNGYYYVSTTAYYPSSVTAVIYRENPAGQSIKSSSNVYRATTNMLARISGACYWVHGSVNTSGNGWHFCW
jgi:hypothetical protein